MTSPNTVRPEEEIDTRFTDEVVCPYCGHEHRNSLELFSWGEEDAETDCGECGEWFIAQRHCSVTYTTEKLKAKK